MSDADDFGNAISGAILGLIFGALSGVFAGEFVFADASFSVTGFAFVGAMVFGVLGMAFGRPVTKCFKAICRFLHYWSQSIDDRHVWLWPEMRTRAEIPGSDFGVEIFQQLKCGESSDEVYEDARRRERLRLRELF